MLMLETAGATPGFCGNSNVLPAMLLLGREQCLAQRAAAAMLYKHVEPDLPVS